MTGPFQGISVLELSSGIAGPYCGMLLADLGANVIKAEPLHGDPARGSPAFHVWNRGKRSVIADPQSEEGRRTIRRLASVSHVVIADLPPGQGEALGLDYEALAGGNPTLVYCHMPPFGDRGPHAGRCPDDALVAAVGGVTVAALLSRRFRGGAAVAVLSGGNLDPEMLAQRVRGSGPGIAGRRSLNCTLHTEGDHA